jgi:hypothetical protein
LDPVSKIYIGKKIEIPKLIPIFIGLLSEVTDEGGFATVGPFVPGESITVHVANNG